MLNEINNNIDNILAYALRGAEKLDRNAIVNLKEFFIEKEKEYKGEAKSKFKTGSHVYVVRANRNIQCGACQGKGKRLISIFHDTIITCPECEGTGTIYSYQRKHYYVVDAPYIVLKIKVREYSEGKKIGYDLENTSTGVPCHTKYIDETKADEHTANQLFYSREEAQAACDKLNRIEESKVINNEIKPCPFCGSKAKITQGFHLDSVVYKVACCDNNGAKCIATAGWGVEPEDAITDWNRRSYEINAEQNVLATNKETQDTCNKLNEECRTMKVFDIKIKNLFRNSVPADYKIAQRIREYKETGKFSNQIVLNKNGFLKDGYTQYLVCKMLDIPTVEVFVK